MSETTLSSPVTRGGAGGNAVHLLFVAHHPDPRRIGEAIALDRSPIELGRDARAFDDLLEVDHRATASSVEAAVIDRSAGSCTHDACTVRQSKYALRSQSQGSSS